jgi:hypothetical protein
MMHDARLPSWSLAGTAGGTVVLRGAVPVALAEAEISLWLGGSVDDVDDMTGATEVTAVVDDGHATWTVAVPTERDPVPLRWSVDGVPATVGALIPSRVGALVREEHVPLAVGESTLQIALGTYDDSIPDDSLGIVDPDTAEAEFRRLLLLFLGSPPEGSEPHTIALQAASGFGQVLPMFGLEPPVDLHAAMRNVARFLGALGANMGMFGQFMGDTDSRFSELFNRIDDLGWRVDEHDTRLGGKADPPFVRPDDPALDGVSNTAIGTMWIKTDEHPHAIHVRGTDGSGTETWVRINPPEEAP